MRPVDRNRNGNYQEGVSQTDRSHYASISPRLRYSSSLVSQSTRMGRTRPDRACLKRHRTVWHVRRNMQNFALMHHYFAPLQFEFERAFQDISDLLALMMMQRHDRIPGGGTTCATMAFRP